MDPRVFRRCPFCRMSKHCETTELRYESGNKWTVECRGCGARGPVYATEKEALNAWNVRPLNENAAPKEGAGEEKEEKKEGES